MTDQATTNILKAIKVVVDSGIPNVIDFYRSENRINSVGDALELFAKDIFADSVKIKDKGKKDEAHIKVFSWGGSANHPPDFMIKGGDAVEVKKITSLTSRIALNSSYPSAKLFSSNPLILPRCRDCEVWDEKDIIYFIGCIDSKKTGKTQKTKNRLSSLWLIYGDCSAASKEYYERIKVTLKDGINDIQGLEIEGTNELGRVNKIDPLGASNLRIRGMWEIDHPATVHSSLDTSCNDQSNKNISFKMIILMRKSKYESFPKVDQDSIISLQLQNKITVRDVKIKSPDNNMERVEAKLFIYEI